MKGRDEKMYESWEGEEGEEMDNVLICPQIALVNWTKLMGLTLIERDLKSIKIETSHGKILEFEILQLFPFTSERKRMGIIVKVRQGRQGLEVGERRHLGDIE